MRAVFPLRRQGGAVRCSGCGTALDRPGDHCLVCDTSQIDAVVVALRADRATVTMMDGETVLGDTTITTRPEQDDPAREIQERNYVERVAAEIRRKRPEAAYVAGERGLIVRLRGDLAVDLYRIAGEDPVAAYRDRLGTSPLTVVERAPAEKLGGRHSTLIGDRRGREVVRLVAEHPHVKTIIPGPIDAGGNSSSTGFRAKPTRADRGGNLRVLLHDGSSVQEVRLVTTAGTAPEGERIARQLTEAMDEAGVLG